MSKFKERLKLSLKQNGMSQNELARRIGMSQSVVNNYCTGKREPSLETFVLICKTLEETADYMLGLDE